MCEGNYCERCVDEAALALVDYPSPARDESAIQGERQILVGVERSPILPDVKSSPEIRWNGGEDSHMTQGQFMDVQMEPD